jgi:serine/threonine protein kinase
VVLLKQTNHDNILPFYGVSTDVSNFCLVFPWYENGNIMDYLKENPDINRYYLVSTFQGPYALGAYLNFMSSYWVRPMDYVSCMKVAWFTETCDQYVEPYSHRWWLT